MTIQDMTEKQARETLRRELDRLYRRLEKLGVPYPASIADAAGSAGDGVLAEKFADVGGRK